jgi:hypothetical protein
MEEAQSMLPMFGRFFDSSNREQWRREHDAAALF